MFVDDDVNDDDENQKEGQVEWKELMSGIKRLIRRWLDTDTYTSHDWSGLFALIQRTLRRW